jgi:uncharacterized membrane protein (Fun14 family)
MSDAATSVASAGIKATPLWIKALLAGSVLLMGAGVAWPMLSPAAAPAAGGMSAMANGLAPAGDGVVSGDPAALWSPAVFRLGFSFFVAFVVAYAVRSFLQMAMIAAGFMLLMLFGLQYAGLIEVKWKAMEDRYEGASSWVSAETKSVTAFLTGVLPSGAAAATGLAAGFRRK